MFVYQGLIRYLADSPTTKIWRYNHQVLIFFPLRYITTAAFVLFCTDYKALLFFISFFRFKIFLYFFPILRHPNLRSTAHPLTNRLACKPRPFLHIASCFATLRHSIFGITTHPLANYFGPIPIGRCSPLAFDTLLFFHLPDSVLRLLHRLQSFALLRFRFKAFLHFFNPSTLQPPYHCPSPLQTVLPTSLLHSSTFIFCNPSRLQPRSHCSSPSKLSWSEPQRPLLSVDLRLLTFFPSAWLCVTAFAPLAKVCCSSFRVSCLGLNLNGHCSPLTFRSLLFFSIYLTWLCVQHIFRLSCVSFLHFPHFTTFSSILLHAPPLLHAFPLFSRVFSYLFPCFFEGPRGNWTLPSPHCLVVHAPLNKSKNTPSTPSTFEISWATSPPLRSPNSWLS